MTFRDCLLMAAAHAGVAGKQSDIARHLGLNRQTINRWFRGTIPDTRLLTMAAKRFGVDPTWMATGEGNMISGAPQALSGEERDLIRFYRNAQPTRRKALYDMAKAIGKSVVIVALTIPALIATNQAEAAFNITFAQYTLCAILLIVMLHRRMDFKYS